MVSRIGHVGLRVTDLDRSVEFATTVLGLREVERHNGRSYLTCNERHHELVLLQAEAAGCDHLGLEVPDAGALEQLRERVASQRYPAVDEPVEPGVEAAFRFRGPGGFVFELFTGMETDQPADYATEGIRPRKFEHITIKSAHKDEMEAFLQDMLGFRLSDRAGDVIAWFHCDADHHGLSVIAAPVNQLQHYAWTVDGWDAVRQVGDHLAERGRTFLWGPGHHGIGDNYFCYFADPEGAIVEFSANVLQIEDDAAYSARTWPDEPLSVNKWGNPPPPVEFLDGGHPLVEPTRAEARTA